MQVQNFRSLVRCVLAKIERAFSRSPFSVTCSQQFIVVESNRTCFSILRGVILKLENSIQVYSSEIGACLDQKTGLIF